jgi:hypothetical protein
MWIHQPSELFSLDIVPDGNDTLSTIFNKVTRIFLIILFIMICYSYPLVKIAQVFIIGLIGILLIYFFTNKKEMFSPVTIKMDEVNPIHVQEVQSIHETPPLPVDMFSNSFQLLQHPSTPISSLHSEPRHSTPIVSLSDKKEHYGNQLGVNGYSYQSQPNRDMNFYTPDMGVNPQMKREPVILAPRIMDPEFTNINTNFPVDTNPVKDLGGMQLPEYHPRRPNLLLDRHRAEYEVSENQMRPHRMFVQDVQPNVFSFTNERTPINANLGISSTPQFPPLRKEVFRGNDGRPYPLYSRIDPQLVRDDVPEERKREMPRRNQWSEDLPGAAPNNPMYNIYDPRFTGYGDANRSYYDINLGQIKYYYSDVDAYRSPNFIIRNKVDHVDMIDPMGKVHHEYPRTASLEDVNDTVHDDWMAKSTEFREDIMEKLMRKNNSQSWQLRMAPHSKGSRLSTFTSGY